MNYKKAKKIPTSISLSPEVREYLRENAEKSDLSVSYYVENLIVTEMRKNGYYAHERRRRA